MPRKVESVNQSATAPGVVTPRRPGKASLLPLGTRLTLCYFRDVSCRTIIVLATLDTKGREAQYLRESIEGQGHEALLIDASVLGEPAARADISREKVADLGGKPLSELRQNPTREEAAPVMAAGATKIVSELVAEGKAHAILSLGGTQGTTLAPRVLRSRSRSRRRAGRRRAGSTRRPA